MSWRESSNRILHEILGRTPRRCEESTEDYRKRLLKEIRIGYPFAQRRGFAYKCWCEERARLLYTLGLKDEPPKKSRKPKEPPNTKQLSLLDLPPPFSETQSVIDFEDF